MIQALILELAAEDVDLAVAAPEDDANKDVNASDSAVIKLVNQIIIDAYRRGASDIHIEPNGGEKSTVVRFRIDGECVAYQELPSALRNSLVARIKIMARLDIAERRKPQDGKIRFKVKEQAIELRVATIPTVNQNEDVVLRILAASKPLPLDRMGMSERNLRELKEAADKPYGLILCVGPTGSGKTTTLHSLLGHINTVDRKIWTAEDPVEITQAGLRQVQMQPKMRVHRCGKHVAAHGATVSAQRTRAILVGTPPSACGPRASSRGPHAHEARTCASLRRTPASFDGPHDLRVGCPHPLAHA